MAYGGAVLLTDKQIHGRDLGGVVRSTDYLFGNRRTLSSYRAQELIEERLQPRRMVVEILSTFASSSASPPSDEPRCYHHLFTDQRYAGILKERREKKNHT